MKQQENNTNLKHEVRKLIIPALNTLYELKTKSEAIGEFDMTNNLDEVSASLCDLLNLIKR